MVMTKVDSDTIELIVHTSCYCILDLLCVMGLSWITEIKRTERLRTKYIFVAFVELHIVFITKIAI